MAGAEVGCLDEHPLDVVAELVEVADDLIEAEGQMPPDVLEHDHWWAKDRDGVADVGPEVSLVLLTQSAAGLTERLARVSASDDVNGLDGRPLDAGDVAEVRDAGEAVGEDRRRVADHDALLVVLRDVGHPRGLGAEHLPDGQIEAAVSSPKTGSQYGGFRTYSSPPTGRRTSPRCSSARCVVPAVAGNAHALVVAPGHGSGLIGAHRCAHRSWSASVRGSDSHSATRTRAIAITAP